MRLLLAAHTLLFTALAAASPEVNLDAPGALDALRTANRAHYDRVVAALDAAQLQPCETLPRVLKASIRADDIRCNSALLLTSFPAKRHISFRLDDVTYVSNVVQTRLDAKATLVPATTR